MQKDTLHRLAAELSLEERHELLGKLREHEDFPHDPLYKEDDALPPGTDAAAAYALLPWYLRVWYFIVGIFSAKTAQKAYEDSKLNSLARKINAEFPGLYHHQKTMLLQGFFDQIEKLRDASRFFFTVLDAGVNRDKGACFAFLGSLEAPQTHMRLYAASNPRLLCESRPEAQEAELRRAALGAMEDAIAGISLEERDALYLDARSLLCLKELSAFPYDRVTLAFSRSNAEGAAGGQKGLCCPAALVRELLIQLNDILFSLKVIPPMPLLESLFVFQTQKRAQDASFNMGKELDTFLAKAQDSLQVIRGFNQLVPLSGILRCALGDLNLAPTAIGGGEEWFVLYREYWKQKIEENFAAFFQDKQRADLLEALRVFLKGNAIVPLNNAESEANPLGIPVSGSFSLAFLQSFYTYVFMPQLNAVLKLIMLDGDFLRRENKGDFTGSYNTLVTLEDDICKFDRSLSLDGDYGKRYALLRSDITSLQSKRHRMELLMEELNSAAKGIAARAQEAAASLINLLKGILNNERRGGKYEGLLNVDMLSARDPSLARGLTGALASLQELLRILEALPLLEEG
ncbi:MAG: DUF5312 domain-containing protein [Treponema sp.]|jgi:hypothetical protein|nr:DUF5312 domain-containing protein [Treponema sp.]